jgi:hypothetical protein
MSSANAPVAQLDRALDSDSKGHAFESHRAYHVVADYISFAAAFFTPPLIHSVAPPYCGEAASLGFTARAGGVADFISLAALFFRFQRVQRLYQHLRRLSAGEGRGHNGGSVYDLMLA